MKKGRLMLLSLAAIALCAGCGKRKNVEAKAAQLLQQARNDMSLKQYDAARITIKEMRKSYPMALKARAAAIITLDSLELLQAQDSLAFYAKLVKTEEDKFAPLERQRSHVGRNRIYFDQKNRLNKARNQYDDVQMKVKFYKRKIEEDKKKNQ